MVLVEPDLPEAGVPGQDHRVAAAVGERVECLAHAPRPVLVVPHAGVQPMALEHVGVFLEILTDRDVDAEPLPLGPPDERSLPVPPAGAAAPDRQPEWFGPFEEPTALAIGLRLHLAPRRLGLDAEPGRQRAFERHAVPAGVERRAAPVVVRVPGGGGEHEQDRLARRAGRRPNHQEGVGALVARREGHGVVAGSPGSNRDLDRRGPVAAIGRRVGRGRVIGGRHQLRAPHDLAFGPLARDLDVERSGVAGDVEPGGFPRGDALRPAVGLQHQRKSAK